MQRQSMDGLPMGGRSYCIVRSKSPETHAADVERGSTDEATEACSCSILISRRNLTQPETGKWAS
jgi:hypothetical protein